MDALGWAGVEVDREVYREPLAVLLRKDTRFRKCLQKHGNTKIHKIPGNVLNKMPTINGIMKCNFG